jgi:hypothetical protein
MHERLLAAVVHSKAAVAQHLPFGRLASTTGLAAHQAVQADPRGPLGPVPATDPSVHHPGRPSLPLLASSMSADAPSRTGRLLTLVHTLIDYGRYLAAALQQRASATDLADITRHFGIVDIGQILARITRGLLRAAALEARLISRPVREPATLTAPSPRQPRAAQPEDGSAAADDPRIARLPTPGDIAAEIRRRPAGAVLADICRDLGIMPSNPLWRELSAAIISYGGNLAALLGDIADRHGLLLTPPARRRAARGTGTGLAIHGEARHRPSLTKPVFRTIEA